MKPAKSGIGVRASRRSRTKSPKKRAASGMLTAGGMTSRIASLGWSWWTPWMMKWRRSPPRNFGSQWKTSRCSQYSVSVQITSPARTSSADGPGAEPAVEPEPDAGRRRPGRRRPPGSRDGPGRRSRGSGSRTAAGRPRAGLSARCAIGEMVAPRQSSIAICGNAPAWTQAWHESARHRRRAARMTRAAAAAGSSQPRPSGERQKRTWPRSSGDAAAQEASLRGLLLPPPTASAPSASTSPAPPSGPTRPEGLVPPRQPALLMRDRGARLARCRSAGAVATPLRHAACG